MGPDPKGPDPKIISEHSVLGLQLWLQQKDRGLSSPDAFAGHPREKGCGWA